MAGALALSAVAGVLEVAGGGEVLRFVVAGLALAALAAVIGRAIEQVGERLGPSATGLLQSTLGNLPELFVSLFALDRGLYDVVRASLAGSILGNAVLVLGCAFVAGGLRHGRQRFDPDEPRLNASLLLLVVAALLIPTLAQKLSTPAAAHAGTLSTICAVALLVVYVATIPFSLRAGRASKTASPAGGDGAGAMTPTGDATGSGGTAPSTATAAAPSAVAVPSAGSEPSAGTDLELEVWSLRTAVVVLAIASAAAALVSDWFVAALEPATRSLGISAAFTGLVIVAIASNAVEHAVGIRFALKAKPDFAISTTLNSPLQVALFLIPVLVLASNVVGAHQLTLVWPPLLIAALAISALVVLAVVYDGEYTWIEGVALIGLYVITAAGFWWG